MSQDKASALSDPGAPGGAPGAPIQAAHHLGDNDGQPTLSLNTSGSQSLKDSPLPPAFPESTTEVPVTPGIDLATYRDESGEQDDHSHNSRGYPVGNDQRRSSATSDNGYFASPNSDLVSSPVGVSEGEGKGKGKGKGKGERAKEIPPEELDGNAESPETPTAATASSPATTRATLNRISLAKMGGRRESLSDVRALNPDLALSGNIISATFNIPYSLKYRKGTDWGLNPRRGQSALFDSFSHLSSDETPWNHTVVAWTGEIEPPHDVLSPPDTPPATTANLPALNTLSKPIPVNGETPAPSPSSSEGLWIPREDQLRLESQLSRDKRIKTVAMWLSDDSEATEDGIWLKDQPRWRRFAEHELYNLFHYKQHEPNDGRKERVQWADYYRMNQKFANKIMEICKPGDMVVVHDYYLMLLPSMLRQRAPHMYISFFLHSPFPSSEFFRCLPRRKEVLEGVLGANMVGFQSYSYSRHFSSCCTRVLGYASDAKGVNAYGARVEVGVFPIGIDARKVEELAWSGSVSDKCEALRTMYEGKKLIVGRDRLDSVRGVAQKLQAFERFLENYPEWREKVVLMQVTSPTSIEEEKEDNKVTTLVNELVMKINGLYGSLGFSPVQHFSQYLSQDEYFALLRAADIGLITSVRDGMNTTSMEYVVCQRDSHGPLILSEFSGTAGSLLDAIHINPWDFTSVADEINGALTVSPERRRAMQASLYRHVTTKTVQSWIGDFVAKLVRVLGSGQNTITTPLLDRAALLRTYRAAHKRLFMFDYDGTLTPIVREPSAAVPTERLLQTLKALAADERNAVWVISGRDQDFLSQHLGHVSKLGFSAEHGSFMKKPGDATWENLAEKFDMGWQEEVMACFQKYTDKVPGSFIERKRCALTWHYRLADPEQGVHMSRECHKELESTVGRKWDVEVMPGKANLEVRPTFINKGEIAKRLVLEYNAKLAAEADKKMGRTGASASTSAPRKVDFVLCMGDDFTDEDMFRSLNTLSVPADGATEPEVKPEHVYSTTVGASTKVTLARWHLLEPEDTVECVALLAGAAGSGAQSLASAGEGVAETVAPLGLSENNLAALSEVEGRVPDLP